MLGACEGAVKGWGAAERAGTTVWSARTTVWCAPARVLWAGRGPRRLSAAERAPTSAASGRRTG
jgi:hypothetical protein